MQKLEGANESRWAQGSGAYVMVIVQRDRFYSLAQQGGSFSIIFR